MPVCPQRRFDVLMAQPLAHHQDRSPQVDKQGSVGVSEIVQAVGFGGIGIYWHSEAAMCHADTRAGKATWLCTSPGVYPSTTYNSFILPTIRQGSVGAANRSAIILLQKLLKIKEDGNFGPATTQALLSAQKQNGLVADGICGPASWKKLSGADKYLAKL